MAENVLKVKQGGTGQSTQWLPQAKAKTADESVTSSTTLQNDDHLSFEGVAGATYQFTINAKATANASGGFKWAFTLPASGIQYKEKALFLQGLEGYRSRRFLIRLYVQYIAATTQIIIIAFMTHTP